MLVVIATALLLGLANGACDTWPTTCELHVGEPASVNGLPEIVVEQGEKLFFTFTVPATVPDGASVAISVVLGDPDIYIKRGDTTEPSFTNADYSSISSGNEDVVNIPKVNMTANQVFGVMVYGFRQSTFSILYSITGGTVTLKDGLPQSGSVDARGYQYYKYHMEHPGDPLTITLTKLVGDPDLLIADGLWRPTLRNNTRSELSIGDDVITIDVPVSHPDSWYTIGVYAIVNSEYTVVASQDGLQTLLDGVPQGASVEHGVSHEYLLRSLGTDHPITISFSCDVGALQYYIKSGTSPQYPSRADKDWEGSASFDSPSSLTIRPGDHGFLDDAGGYYIIVFGYTPQNIHQLTTFTITAKSALAATPLQDGEPVRDTVDTGSYRYYSIAVSSKMAVSIDLTPLTGDADMFVSCNKSLTGNIHGSPSRSHNTWSSQAWGEDTITIEKDDPNSCVHGSHRGGTFYVAVYGFNNATYTITSALDNGQPTTLKIGQPQTGRVFAGQGAHYQVQMPGPTTDLTVSVSPAYGDADLYVSIGNASIPSPSNWAYRSIGSSGADAVVIRSDGAGCRFDDISKCFCDNCVVNILVNGFTTSAYTIVATTAGSVLTLQDGIPVLEHVDTGIYEYFRFTNPTAGNTLQFTVTPLSGDADICVSQNPNPKLGNASWVSVQIGGDQLTVQSAEAGDYYIGVYGFRNTTFTISAHIISGGSDKHVIPGIPQAGFVEGGEYNYYTILIDSTADVIITATPLEGLIGLVANPCHRRESDCTLDHPFIDNSVWNANESFSQESIVISRNDPSSCVECVYVVGVFGKTRANYTLLVATNSGTGITTLQEFVPFRGYVKHYQSQFFRFTFSEADRDVVISVTAFTGDPDVFVNSCGYNSTYTTGPVPACNTRPTNTSHMFSHASVGADTISISGLDPRACIPLNGVSCEYYINVYGFTDASFSVTAYLHSDLPVALVNGQPQNGAVNASVMDQYTMDIPANSSHLDVLLTPRSGDADLYVTLDGRAPSSTEFDFRSIAAFGNDEITVDSTSPKWIENGCLLTGCRLRIGVLGFQVSQYTLVATTSLSATTLVPGLPSRKTVRHGSYAQFVFAVDTEAALSFVVTPLSGDPDLYCGVGSDYAREAPTKDHYIWKSEGLGVDVIEIYPREPHACDTSAGNCLYYCGVTGFSQETSFLMTASMTSADPITLLDGQPQTGSVDTGITKEYIFFASPGWTSVQVTLTPIFGDADLYVTLGDQLPPNRENSDYRSTSTSGNEAVVVHSTDDYTRQNCPITSQPCPIRIGVNGYTNASFTVGASLASTTIDLQDGVPLYDQVESPDFKYFVFRNQDPDPAMISIAITPFSGDPDVYVACDNHHPSSSNFTWMSAGLSRDVVEIQPDDPHACTPPCNYYIGVTAYRGNASFSVLATKAENAVVQLIPGQPQINGVPQGSSREYVLYVAQDTPDIFVTLTPLLGDSDLYVNLSPDAPTRANAMYRSVASQGDDSITITSLDNQYKNSICSSTSGVAVTPPLCIVRIAVYGFSPLSFFALVASSSSAQMLIDGSPVTDTITSGSMRQYFFEVRDPSAEIVVSLTPINGDPDMWVSTTPNANASNYHWKAASTGVDIVEIYPDEEYACREAPCRYFIGIKAFSQEAQYTISATTRSSSPTFLIDGQPQVAFTNHSRTNLYFFDIPADAKGFSISVAPIYGDPDVYMNLNDIVPKRGHSQYQSVSSRAQDAIIISKDDPNFVNCTHTRFADGSHCRAYIGVYGFSATQYRILAALDDGLVRLSEGVATQGSVSSPDYTYFVFTIRSRDFVNTITLTPLSGDPDVYVSNNYTDPTSVHNMWYSNTLSSETITIDPSDERVANCVLPCSYYIGVTAFRGTAAFQILVSTNDTITYDTLADGQPQRGSVVPFQFHYYLYRAAGLAGDITFTATPLSGSVELFVDNQIDSEGNVIPPTADCTDSQCIISDAPWTSRASFDRASVTIASDDDGYCGGCFYVVAVLSTTHDPAEFNIVASSAGTISNLQDGVPFTDFVSKHQYKYYHYIVTDPSQDVEISLTAFFGDPDLYVSWDPSNSRPSSNHYDARSISQFNDTIYIQSANLEGCQSVTVGGRHCQLYLGVNGFSTASYSILVRQNDGFNTPTVLVDGTPQVSTVGLHEWAYFRINANFFEPTAYSVTITPNYGDPDLYVTTDGSEPTRSNYNYTSGSSGFDSVVFLPSEQSYCSQCVVNVGIYGFQASSFMITFSTNTSNSVTSLREGISEYGILSADTYRYYKIYVDNSTSDLTIAVSALSGSPTLFAIVETHDGDNYVLPTAAHYTWSSLEQGGRVLTVLHNDINFVAPATYVIGVYGDTAVNYFVTASISSSSEPTSRHIRLYDGVQQQAYVAADSYTFFDFSSGGKLETITVRVDSLSLSLYATNAYVQGDASTLPTRSNYMWSSATSDSAGNLLVIPYDDPAVNADKPGYTIGVYSFSTTSFTISASTAEVPQTLSPGRQSLHHFVGTNVTKHFRIEVTDPSSDIIISVSPLTGDPDLFLSDTFRDPGCYFSEAPNPYFSNAHCSHYNWSSTLDQQDVLAISASDPCATPPGHPGSCDATSLSVGTYYLGVFGYNASWFDISLFLSGPNDLIPGQSQKTSLSLADPAYFHFEVHDTDFNPSLKLDVSLNSTSRVILYMTSCKQPCSVADQKPSPSHHTWQSFISSTSGPLFIGSSDPNYCTTSTTGAAKPCNYYIGLYTDPTSCTGASCILDVAIRVSIQDGSDVQTIRYPDYSNQIDLLPDVVPSGSATNYQLWLNEEASAAVTVDFDIEACRGPTGSPKLFVCDSRCQNPTSPADPSNTNAQTVSSRVGGSGQLSFVVTPGDVNVFGTVKIDGTARPSSPTLNAPQRRLRVDSEDQQEPVTDAVTSVTVPAAGSMSESRMLSSPVLGEDSAWMYLLRLSAQRINYRLTAPPGATLTVSDPGVTPTGLQIVGFRVSWTLPLVSGGAVAGVTGAKYTVYLQPGTFDADMMLTPCGLDTVGTETITITTTETFVDVDNLLPTTSYSIVVVAECDENCWRLSGHRSTDLYIDRAAYPMATATTPEAPTPSGSGGPGPVVIVIIVVVVVAVIGVAAFVYNKKRRGSREHQYELYDVSGTDGTYITPAASYTAMD